jgi:hypothetical protein
MKWLKKLLSKFSCKCICCAESSCNKENDDNNDNNTIQRTNV